jgi:drug/metabolite transporter (DMT)-like permease
MASKTPWYALLVLTLVIWSNSFVAIQAALRHLTPLDLLAARFLPVGLFCTAWCLWRWRETVALLRAEGWKIAFMGLMSVAAYNFFLNVGQTHVPAGTAAIIIATNPLQTYLLSMLLLGERPTWIRSAGLLTAFAGLYVVVVWGSHVEVSLPYVGHALLTVLAPFSWALYTLTGKTFMHRHSPLLVTYASLALGSLPAYFLLGGGFAPRALAMPWQGWFSVLYLSVFCTLLGFWFWSAALRHLAATETASFVYLNPPMAVVSAAVFLGHPVKPALVGGLMLVLAGIYLGTKSFGVHVSAATAAAPAAGVDA